jgi:hypothetical protein
MSLGALSFALASTLALSPFSTPLVVRGAEPQADPSWDEPDPGEETPGDPADALAPAPDPTTAPPPVVPVPAPALGPVIKPVHHKGTGLMIAAGVTGGLGWVIAFAKLSALNSCKSAIGQAVLAGSGGASAFAQCLKSTGSMVGLTVPGWIVNDVTYGLAPAAGVYRGQYDGTNAAWEGKPQRPTPVFIGVGAGLLAGGIAGRVATFVAFLRQLNPQRALDGHIPFERYPLGAHFVLQQVAAASIQAGGGLLGYGLAYNKAKTTEDRRRQAAGLANVKLAPQVGWAYTGLGLTGEF